jgi:outer membrane protein OmpA-like peptidoglycan-associated protein
VRKQLRRELLKLGVPESALEIRGMGGKEPVTSVTDMKERWKNRRVVFVIEF